MFPGAVYSLTHQAGVLVAAVSTRGQGLTAHAAARPGAIKASKASRSPATGARGLSIAEGLDAYLRPEPATPPWTGWILPLDVTKKKKLAKKMLAKKLETNADKDPLEVLLATMVGRTDKRLTSEQAKVVRQLLQSGDRSDQLRAAHAVYLLGWNKEDQDTLGRAEIIPPLVDMLESRHSGAQKAAAAAISNLVASNSNRKKLITTTAVQRMLRLLELPSAHLGTKVFAVRALGGFKKCLPSDRHRTVRCIWINEYLERLLKEAHPVLQVEAARALCTFHCDKICDWSSSFEGQALEMLLKRSTPPMPKIVQDAVFEAVTPFAIRFLTAKVLAKDCEVITSGSNTWRAGILLSFVRLLQCKQTRVQYGAAMAVCVLAKRGPPVAMAEALERAGTIPGMVELLYSPTTPRVRNAAFRAVKLLRSNDNLRGKVMAALKSSQREHGPREDVIRLLHEH